MTELAASPFHARHAGANRHNAWMMRNGLTLPQHFDSVAAEALAARTGVVIADISWRWRVMLEGTGVADYLRRLLTRDTSVLAPGAALKALWLNDAGGVRGAGVAARYGRETFQLVASAADADWIARTASVANVGVRDVSRDTGGLGVVGPYARATLALAGFDVELEAQAFRKALWQGCEVMVSRFGEQGGYEIWCAPDDALLVWDRLVKAGARFGIVPAGVAAMDVLDLEAGVPRPHLDYRPAVDDFSAKPAAAAFGLDQLVDRAHRLFNGRRGFEAQAPARVLAGLAFEATEPAPFTPVFQGDTVVGHTLRSAWSPLLRRAVALASLDRKAAVVDTRLTLTLPPTMDAPELRRIDVVVVRLPFVAAPASIAV